MLVIRKLVVNCSCSRSFRGKWWHQCHTSTLYRH